MDKFIEITDIAGEKMLINAAHVVCVEVWRQCECMPLTTVIRLTNGRANTYESYEDIKKKIENAGKTFLHGDLYI